MVWAQQLVREVMAEKGRRQGGPASAVPGRRSAREKITERVEKEKSDKGAAAGVEATPEVADLRF